MAEIKISVFLLGSYNQDDRLINMFVSTGVCQLRGYYHTDVHSY